MEQIADASRFREDTVEVERLSNGSTSTLRKYLTHKWTEDVAQRMARIRRDFAGVPLSKSAFFFFFEDVLIFPQFLVEVSTTVHVSIREYFGFSVPSCVRHEIAFAAHEQSLKKRSVNTVKVEKM